MNGDGTAEPRHSFQIAAADDLDKALKTQIRELHSRCYPGEQDPNDSLEEAFEQICFLHDASDCTWFLLWLPDGGGTAAAANGSSAAAASPNGGSRRLAGMCAGVQYHDSFYVFAFGVDPAFRRQGYGKRIMFGIEVWVLERGLPLKISATVDAAHARLIAFYQSLGAVIEVNGVTSASAPPPPSIRMAKYYDEAEAQAQLAAAEAEIRRSAQRRGAQRRQLLILGHVVAAAAVVGCAWAAVRWLRPRTYDGASGGDAAGSRE